MRKIRTPADAPPWLPRFARDLEKTIDEPSAVPVRIPSFADAAALPPASAWFFGLVHVADINTIAFSDGSDWYPLDKGAAL